MADPHPAPEYVRGPRPGDLHVRLPRSRPVAAPPTDAAPRRSWLLGLLHRWTRPPG
ncbi:MAG TPA: hypothetical protein VII06_23240 [Chloroflexota bacterium]|jgi:hypothetical protein